MGFGEILDIAKPNHKAKPQSEALANHGPNAEQELSLSMARLLARRQKIVNEWHARKKLREWRACSPTSPFHYIVTRAELGEAANFLGVNPTRFLALQLSTAISLACAGVLELATYGKIESVPSAALKKLKAISIGQSNETSTTQGGTSSVSAAANDAVNALLLSKLGPLCSNTDVDGIRYWYGRAQLLAKSIVKTVDGGSPGNPGEIVLRAFAENCVHIAKDSGADLWLPGNSMLEEGKISALDAKFFAFTRCMLSLVATRGFLVLEVCKDTLPAEHKAAAENKFNYYCNLSDNNLIQFLRKAKNAGSHPALSPRAAAAQWIKTISDDMGWNTAIREEAALDAAAHAAAILEASGLSK